MQSFLFVSIASEQVQHLIGQYGYLIQVLEWGESSSIHVLHEHQNV